MSNTEEKQITPEQKEQIPKTPDISPEKKDLKELNVNVDTKTKIDDLKKEVIDNVEADTDRTYRLIQGSKMESKLKEIGKDDKEIKEFAENIDAVVRKFLDQELVGFSNKIKNSMSVGIQFAMMETLITNKQGVKGSTAFFNAFSKTDSKSASTAFDGLFNAFGNLGSTNDFFVLANKVQNLTRYLSDKKNTIVQSTDIPELINPLKFKELLNNPIRSNQAQIDKLDIAKVLTLDSKEAENITQAEDQLKKIINNEMIQGVITEESIAAIQKSLKTADTLLDTRGKFKDKSSELVKKLDGIIGINLPFVGNLGELMGLNFPTDILGKGDKEPKGMGIVINFVLGVLGFHGGLKGLHRSYIKEKLDDLHIDNAFVVAAYSAFQKNADATLSNDSDAGTWKTCALTAPDSTKEAAMKAKIPADYAGLKKSLADNLDTATLNPIMVAKFAPEFVIADTDKNIVDIAKITANKDVFVDSYLKYIIPLLADPGDSFISSKTTDKNSFALAVMGGLVGDKYFIEGVKIGLVSTTDFVEKTTISSDQNSTKIDSPTPGTEEIANKAELISYIQKVITSGESAGKYDAVNPFDVTGVSLGLLQRHDVRAKELLVKMQTEYPTEFFAIMGNDFKNLDTPTLWNTKRDTDKVNKFQALMKIDTFQKIMDEFLKKDINQYISNAVDHGIKDPAMIVYYCYMQNAGATWAKGLLDNLSSKDMQDLHKKVLASSYIKTYPAIGKKFEVLYADLQTKDFTDVQQNFA